MELWDVYDREGNRTGRTHPRGTPLAPGDYHLAVTVTVVNSRGEVLLTRRSLEKTLMPGVWECPGGGVLAGETSREGAARELLEETGIQALPEELVFLARRTGPDWYMDDYGLRRDLAVEELALQPGETDAAQWMPLDQWEQEARAGKLFATGYTEALYTGVRGLAAAEELLDIYDQEGNRTGRTQWRGRPLALHWVRPGGGHHDLQQQRADLVYPAQPGEDGSAQHLGKPWGQRAGWGDQPGRGGPGAVRGDGHPGCAGGAGLSAPPADREYLYGYIRPAPGHSSGGSGPAAWRDSGGPVVPSG